MVVLCRALPSCTHIHTVHAFYEHTAIATPILPDLSCTHLCPMHSHPTHLSPALLYLYILSLPSPLEVGTDSCYAVPPFSYYTYLPYAITSSTLPWYQFECRLEFVFLHCIIHALYLYLRSCWNFYALYYILLEHAIPCLPVYAFLLGMQFLPFCVPAMVLQGCPCLCLLPACCCCLHAAVMVILLLLYLTTDICALVLLYVISFVGEGS